MRCAAIGRSKAVRSRAKIEGAVRNARLWCELIDAQGPGAFRDLLWQHVGHRTLQPRLRTLAQIPAVTPQSEAMAKQLRKAGYTFCGPTICYAFMQAVGMVNDHTVDCFRYKKVGRA